MSETLATQETMVIDTVQLLSMQIVHWPVDQQTMVITFAEGHNDEQGNFIPVRRKQLQADQEAYRALMATDPNYSGMRAFCYEQIAKVGATPPVVN